MIWITAMAFAGEEGVSVHRDLSDALENIRTCLGVEALVSDPEFGQMVETQRFAEKWDALSLSAADLATEAVVPCDIETAAQASPSNHTRLTYEAAIAAQLAEMAADMKRCRTA